MWFKEWVVDAEGNFIEVTHDCIEVAHRPDPDNIWICSKCRSEGRFEDVPDGAAQISEELDSNKSQADETPVFYKATFYLTLTPGREITQISKALSNAIAEEINQEFPEIDTASSCEFEKENK